MDFGKRLNLIRKWRGYTAQQMADCIGVNLRSYRAYESGDREPKFSTLIIIAEQLGVTTDCLLGVGPIPEELSLEGYAGER